MKFGHEQIIPGRVLIGGMAEYCHLPEKTAIFKVPPSVADVVACPPIADGDRRRHLPQRGRSKIQPS